MIVAAGTVSSYNVDKKICHTGGDRAMPSYRKSAQVDMTHGSVLGRAALFALPICAGNILQLLYSTVDTLVIGNFCDTTALASVATARNSALCLCGHRLGHLHPRIAGGRPRRP